MARTERITIGEDTYVITPLGATVAGDLWDDIVAALGEKIVPELEGLSAKLTSLKGVDLESEATKAALLATFLPVLVKVLATVPKAIQQRWRKLFAEQTTVCTGSAELNMASAQLFDSMFSGRLGARYQWELAHLKLNFFGFLGSKPSAASSDPGAK